MTENRARADRQLVKLPRKPTAAQVAAAMTISGLPADAVCRVYRAMIEAVGQDAPDFSRGPGVSPRGNVSREGTAM